MSKSKLLPYYVMDYFHESVLLLKTFHSLPFLMGPVPLFSFSFIIKKKC